MVVGMGIIEAGWKLEFGLTTLCFTLIDYLNRQEFSRKHNSKVTRNLSLILSPSDTDNFSYLRCLGVVTDRNVS